MDHAAPATPDDRPAAPVVVQLSGGGATRIVGHGGRGAPDHDSGLTPRRPCTLYKPGHHVHVIQVRLAIGTPSTAYRLRDVDGQTVTVQRPGHGPATWWLHDTEAVRAALLLEDDPVVHLHGHGLARIGTTLLYPCVDGAREPCASFAGR